MQDTFKTSNKTAGQTFGRIIVGFFRVIFWLVKTVFIVLVSCLRLGSRLACDSYESGDDSNASKDGRKYTIQNSNIWTYCIKKDGETVFGVKRLGGPLTEIVDRHGNKLCSFDAYNKKEILEKALQECL